MEDRPPPDDDLFEFDTGEHRRSDPSGDDPYDTGEYRRRARGADDELAPDDPGEPEVDDPLETAERAIQAGAPPPWEEDPFIDTSEARRRAAERGDHFDTGEYRRHRGARPRHRDLPANIRRRQIFGVAALVILVLVGAYLLLFSGGGGSGGSSETPLKRLVGQTMIGVIPDGGVNAQFLKRVEKGQLGGVIISTDNEGDVQQDAAKLQKAARQGGNPPVLIMADQEGGHVKALPGPPDLFPTDITKAGPASAKSEGEKTGEYLAGLGVNVNLAPVVDVAHPQTVDTIVSRTFSDDPATVGEIGSAFITGIQSKGVAATAKHFPGLGLATQNTDFEQVSVNASSADFQADLVPFQQAIAAGVDLVMVSTANYGDLSGNEPAAFSGKMINGQLRGKLGFQGVVITDDLETPAAIDVATAGTAAIQTLRAGGDLALYAQHPAASQRALTAVVKAVREGRLDESVLQDAYDRILALKDKLSSGGPVSTEPASTTGGTETTETTAPTSIGVPSG